MLMLRYRPIHTFAVGLLALMLIVARVANGESPPAAVLKRAASTDQIKARNISVPVDHFHDQSLYEPHSNGTFDLRYWFEDKYYEKGGPVIILAAGETSGEGRLPFLEYGILDILTKATNGIGVILEHRYYGTSFPVPDLSTKNMRFLTTHQALADTAYFAKNVKFAGHEGEDLTARNTPYIIYGGSYAGAFAAFARKLYPDVFWGAIGSSAVTAAIVDYWEYFRAAQLYGPQECARLTGQFTQIIDHILLARGLEERQALKDAFGLGELEDDDFAETIATGFYGLQSTNWDPQEDEPDFAYYCASISSNVLFYSSTRHLEPITTHWLEGAGFANSTHDFLSLHKRFLNYIGYVRAFVKKDLDQRCNGKTAVQCYSIREGLDDTSIDAWPQRSWNYQVCTQWGYFQTGSGFPKKELSPISRIVDLDYLTIPCREGFNITTLPDVEVINKLGGFNFSYPRVAFIDGQADPWRAATPHRLGLPPRESTTSEPFILIEGAVHHWDENGRNPNETSPDLPPKAVVDAQKAQVKFVKAWLDEWAEKHAQ